MNIAAFRIHLVLFRFKICRLCSHVERAEFHTNFGVEG